MEFAYKLAKKYTKYSGLPKEQRDDSSDSDNNEDTIKTLVQSECYTWPSDSGYDWNDYSIIVVKGKFDLENDIIDQTTFYE